MTLGKENFFIFNVGDTGKTDMSCLPCFHLQLYIPVISSKLEQMTLKTK